MAEATSTTTATIVAVLPSTSAGRLMIRADGSVAADGGPGTPCAADWSAEYQKTVTDDPAAGAVGTRVTVTVRNPVRPLVTGKLAEKPTDPEEPLP